MLLHVTHQVELAGALELVLQAASPVMQAFSLLGIQLAELHDAFAPVIGQRDVGQVLHDLPLGFFGRHHFLVAGVQRALRVTVVAFVGMIGLAAHRLATAGAECQARERIGALPGRAPYGSAPACGADLLALLEQRRWDDGRVAARHPLPLILHFAQVEAVLQHRAHGIGLKQPLTPVARRAVACFVEYDCHVVIRNIALRIAREGQQCSGGIFRVRHSVTFGAVVPLVQVVFQFLAARCVD